MLTYKECLYSKYIYWTKDQNKKHLNIPGIQILKLKRLKWIVKQCLGPSIPLWYLRWQCWRYWNLAVICCQKFPSLGLGDENINKHYNMITLV